MPAAIPASKPGLNRETVEIMLTTAGVNLAMDKVTLMGRRGYFRDTLGVAGKNDLNIYDDAMVLVTPTIYATYNANTDPSKLFPEVAILRPGVWRYKIGVHGLSKLPIQRYKALVQAAEVEVYRVGTEHYSAGTRHPKLGFALGRGVWRGMFGINIHRGGVHGTSSLGCQTIHIPQWSSFISAVDSEVKRHGVIDFPYVLTEYAGIP